ncbi:bifunctional DNA primase/polymerase [Streptomyces cavernae]|uniref:bifunctional DNA primase/polymerase n=1 Tax=Streptomyces cavernae TaxID=2259034 RepID=UPI003B75D215
MLAGSSSTRTRAPCSPTGRSRPAPRWRTCAWTPTANCTECRSIPHPPAGCPCLPAGRWCHGFHAATLDQRRIAEWWGAHPEFGVGVACGPASLVVIDIDAHPTQPPTRDRILPGIPIGDHVDLTGLANGFHTLAILAALRGQHSPADDDTKLRVRTPSEAIRLPINGLVWSNGGPDRVIVVGSTHGSRASW